MSTQSSFLNTDGLTGSLARVVETPATKITDNKDDSFINLTESDLLSIDSSGRKAIIDWLAFTVFPVDAPSLQYAAQEIADYIIPEVSWLLLDRGRYGYSSGYAFGSARVWFNPGRLDMGVHVELPSSALAYCGLTPVELIAWSSGLGAKFARLDVALDTDAIHMTGIIHMQRSGEVISRTQNRRIVENLQDGSLTLYVGASSSRRLVRCYDKALERGDDSGTVLTRIEVQFRAEYAHRAALYIRDGVSLLSLILSTIDFRDSDGDDSNKSRWSRSAWWSALLDGVGRVSFAAVDVAASLERAVEWIERQVSGTLAKIDMALGGGWLRGVLFRAASKLSDFDMMQVRSWKEVPLCV